MYEMYVAYEKWKGIYLNFYSVKYFSFITHYSVKRTIDLISSFTL